ncbi:unnamed protein product, partial [Rotaria sp. Silwood2]
MAALPVLLVGAGALVGGKLVWGMFRKSPDPTPYDVIVRINSLEELSTTGWEIVLGQNVDDATSQNPNMGDSRGVVIAVLGSYNRGKTFLLNLLCNTRLPNGNLVHTEGLSITAGRKDAEHTIFIDTAGSDTAIPTDKLDDRKATEALLKEIALHLCSFIIIVVNRLRGSDQSYIRGVLNHSEELDSNKRVFIVHNLMDVITVEDAEKIIKSEIELIFGAKADTFNVGRGKNSTNVKYYSSKKNGKEIRHFIFAKDGSPAAKIWNQQTTIGIINSFSEATTSRRSLDVLNETINFVNTRLPQLVASNYKKKNNLEEPVEQFKIEKHAKKPYIVLSHRKNMEDLTNNPYKFELSQKILYDDAGYFQGINSMTNDEWQPNFNLYEGPDEIVIFIELAGFKQGSARIEIGEESIIVKGSRADLKELLNDPLHPTIKQEKIPTGDFKLQIPLG